MLKEGKMQGFRNRPDSWRKAIYFVEHSQDPYVLWFAFSILEVSGNHFCSRSEISSNSD